MVHGLYAEEAPQDEEGMQTMRNLARNMVWLMRCFSEGKSMVSHILKRKQVPVRILSKGMTIKDKTMAKRRERSVVK